MKQLAENLDSKYLQGRKNSHIKLTHQLCRFIILNNREPSASDNEALHKFLRIRRDAIGKPGRRTWPECLQILEEYGLGTLFDVAKFRPDIFPHRRTPNGQAVEQVVVNDRDMVISKNQTKPQSQQMDLFQQVMTQNNTNELSKQMSMTDVSNLLTQITTGVNFTQNFETLYLSKPVS